MINRIVIIIKYEHEQVSSCKDIYRAVKNISQVNNIGLTYS